MVSLVERETPYLLSAALSPGTPETVVTPHGTGTVTAGVYVGAKRSERYRCMWSQWMVDGCVRDRGAKSGWSLFSFFFLTQSAETDTVQTIRAPAKAWAVAKLARQLQVRQRLLQNTPLLCGIAQ